MVLDTQAKNRKLPGDFGYVHSKKGLNLRYALIFLGLCILIYVIGVLLNNELKPFFNIVSVLLVLPAAQFLAKYFSFIKYKALTKEQFNDISSISGDFLVLGELPIIRGKKVYATLVTVVTKVGAYTYIEPLADLDASRKEKLDTQHALNSILKPKNLGIQAYVYDDFDKMCEYLRTNVKSKAFNADQVKLAKVAQYYIVKTH